MPDVRYLFFHTAAADLDNVDADRIDEWHRARGWSGIGYHYVIIDDSHRRLRDGEVQPGRPENRSGAHVLGVNSISLGICCVGHGDKRDFTAAQKRSLVRLLGDLARKYSVPVERVLGHREVNDLVDAGLVEEIYRTSKTCPGKKVDTDEIRTLVAEHLGARPFSVDGAEIRRMKDALAFLNENRQLFGNAQHEWKQFFHNGEIRGLMEG